MRSDRAYLEDIVEAIDCIEKYTAKGRDEFDSNELVQTWVVHHIQIVGEASSRITEELRLAHSQVPWGVIRAMRNVLVHFYFGIDVDEVWRTVEKDLPILKSQVSTILQTIDRA
jgi:uncharacterized protein with HEPN domain